MKTRQPTQISVNSTYVYRNGNPARVRFTDGVDSSFPIVSERRGGLLVRHDLQGYYTSPQDESPYDLLEVTHRDCGTPIDLAPVPDGYKYLLADGSEKRTGEELCYKPVANTWNKATHQSHHLIKGSRYAIPKESPEPEGFPYDSLRGGWKAVWRGYGWDNDKVSCLYVNGIEFQENSYEIKEVPRAAANQPYWELIPPKSTPYTYETFPMWAVWIKEIKGKDRFSITKVSQQEEIHTRYSIISFSALAEDFVIAGLDGVWQSGYRHLG